MILSTSTAGTTMSDYMDRTLGLGYAKGSLILVSILLAILAYWRLTEKSLSVTNVRTFRVEVLYWTAILFSNTLGTALGDYLADDSGLGFAGGALLIAGLLAIVILATYLTKISHVALFWIAFVLTRPLGATMGDLLTKPHESGGLGFGTIGSSIVLAAVLVAVNIYTIRHQKHKLATTIGIDAPIGRVFSRSVVFQPMIRVELPYHLRTLAQITGEVTLELDGAATLGAVLDALEARYPMLAGHHPRPGHARAPAVPPLLRMRARPVARSVRRYVARGRRVGRGAAFGHRGDCGRVGTVFPKTNSVGDNDLTGFFEPNSHNKTGAMMNDDMAVSRDRTAVDVSLLVVRVVVGVIFAMHGSQLMFGAWGGPGFAKMGETMGVLGYLVSIGQFFGGLGLIFGFCRGSPPRR